MNINQKSTTPENVVVIGSGPAGMAAAIYLARGNLKPLVFAGSPPGGQLILTSEVENFPGCESVLGTELISRMRKQAEKFGARIIDENVTKVDFSRKPFKTYLSADAITKILSQDQLASAKSGPVAPRSTSQCEGSLRHSLAQTTDFRKNFVIASAIIIATGAKALWLGLESETRLRGKGVSACATCDGFFFRNKVVAVVGGGDAAMEEALTLTNFASKVYLIHRRDSFRASHIMQERIFANPKIEVLWNTSVEEVLGEQKVEGIKIATFKSKLQAPSSKLQTNLNDQSSQSTQSITENLKLDGLFVAIGHKPDTDLFKGQIELDEKGYVITSGRYAQEFTRAQMQNHEMMYQVKIENKQLKEMGRKFDLNYAYITSVPGVFAAGDCTDFQYRQAATATGMGVAAALEVEKFLER